MTDRELMSADGLFGEARDMADAQGNELALALIDRLSRLSGERGKIGGPIRHVAIIKAEGRDTYDGIHFEGGKLARVVVIGDGFCDLDLYVYDESGDLVGHDTSYTNTGEVEWTPDRTEAYTITIENTEAMSSPYALISN